MLLLLLLLRNRGAQVHLIIATSIVDGRGTCKGARIATMIELIWRVASIQLARRDWHQ